MHLGNSPGVCGFTQRRPSGATANPSASGSFHAEGHRGCPTGRQMAWDGHLCPTVLSSLMISSTFIIMAFLPFFKERIMTPIYTAQHVSHFEGVALLSFSKEPVRLKNKSHPISLPSLSRDTNISANRTHGELKILPLLNLKLKY